ncbi:hypothetical protein Cmtc_55060 [Cupriavidus sp. TKC]|nr:hypothetical protein Cmtc_55060 [Cupriavidus sp. TKC]
MLLLMQYEPAIAQVFIQGVGQGNTFVDTPNHAYGTSASSVAIIRATGPGVTYTGSSISGTIPAGSSTPTVQATGGGSVAFTGTSTFGINGSSGYVFDASGSGSSISADTVTLTGGQGGIHTSSAGSVTVGAANISSTVATGNAGAIFVDGGTVTTNGSTVINALPGGTANTFYNGVRVNSGGTFNANNALTINVDSVAGSGIYAAAANAIANVNSQGQPIQISLINGQNSGINNVNEAAALRADSGAVTITGNSQLAASQGRGYGMWTGVGGGTITANGNSAIHTYGDQGFGIRLDAGTVQLNGDLSIETGVNPVAGASGVGSAGIRGILGTLNVTGATTINTVGGITPVGSSFLSYTYESAYGIWNTSASRIAGGGSAMTFGGPVTITTSGPAAHGIYNDSNSGTMTFQGPVNVNTTGGSGSVTWYRPGSAAGSNETVGAWGVNSALSGTTTFKGLLTVNTTQATSGGVRSIGGLVDIQNGATITTSGANAYGVYASGKTSPATYNGTIQLSGPTSITTNGSGAHAVFADQAGTVVLNGATIRLADQSAFGVLGSANSSISGTGLFNVIANLQSQNNAQINLTMTPGSVFTGATTRKDGSTFNLTLKDSTWNLTDNSNLSTLVNDPSQIIFAAPVNNTFKTLTVQNYSGNGTIALNTVLASDGAPSDKLVVDGGTATGSSKLRINNAGGAGALTVANGIQVVNATNGGTTAAGAFALDGRAVAGAYEYRLFRGANDGTDANSWYLRSDQTPTPPAPPEPPSPPAPPTPDPLYRPEVAAYLANQRLAGQMFVHSLHDRLGEPQYVEEQGFDRADDKPRSGWLRMVGKWEGSHSADGVFKTSTDSFLLHGGAELAKWKLFRDDGNDRGHLGVMGSYGFASTDANARGNPFSAKGKVEGWSVGAYGTWYQNDEQKLGAYVDTWFQYGWFANRVEGQLLPTVRYNATGWAVSGETGYAIPTRSNWIVEPQGQLIYVGYNEDNITEPNGTQINGANSHGWISRLGVRFHRTYVREEGKTTWQPYLTLNWWHTGVSSNISFNELPLGSMYPSNRYEVKIGANAQFSKRWTGWTNVSGAWGAQSFYQYALRVGVKYTW